MIYIVSVGALNSTHSLPKILLKIVATRGEIYSLKFKYRLAAGLRPDPLGELKCLP